MPRIISIFSSIVATLLAVVLIGGYLIVVQPSMELHRREQINSHAAVLRDRVIATPPDSKALDELIRMLRSDDSFERSEATAVLGQIALRSPNRVVPALDILIDILKKDDQSVSNVAAETLGEMGPIAARAVPDLLAAVQNYPDSGPGFSSAVALGEVADPNDKNVLAVLQTASTGQSELMRDEAKRAINNLTMRRGTDKSEN